MDLWLGYFCKSAVWQLFKTTQNQSFSPFQCTGTTNVSPAQDEVNIKILKHDLCLRWLPSWKQTAIYCSSSDSFLIKAQVCFFSLHLFLSLPTAPWKTSGFSTSFFSNCILPIPEKLGKWDISSYSQLVHYVIKNHFITRECVRDFRNFSKLTFRMFFHTMQ